MNITEYKIQNKNFHKRYVFALVSDLHGDSPEPVIDALCDIRPDFILAAGDIFEPMCDKANDALNEAGFRLLSECAKIATTVFAPGNHEVGGVRSWSLKWKFAHGEGKKYPNRSIERIKDMGVLFLDDSFTLSHGLAFGGLGTGLLNDGGIPNTDFLDEFCLLDCPKILLCHHPEYYKKYLCEKNIDLIVSGHAHGGQWRFFGRGVFAPGQGFFPKYTSGVHNGKLVISRGVKYGGSIPRIFNPPEVVKIVIV